MPGCVGAVLAIDLGGTRVKAGLVRDGEAESVLALEHGAGTLADALVCVAEAVERLAPDGCEAVGLCIPGLVDDGRVIALPGKLEGAVGFDLVDWLHERTGGRGHVVNDAIAYGLGEAADLPGRTVVLTIGTGVGTAVVENGRPLGAGPYGGGLLSGQLPLTGDGPLDTSGRAGTLEAWCRADRILAEVRAAGGDAADVPAAVRAGGPGLDAYRGWLARGIAALCLAHAPDTVVVGGGPAQPEDPLLDGVEALVQPLLWPGQRVSVRVARHGDAAALIGLAALA